MGTTAERIVHKRDHTEWRSTRYDIKCTNSSWNPANYNSTRCSCRPNTSSICSSPTTSRTCCTSATSATTYISSSSCAAITTKPSTNCFATSGGNVVYTDGVFIL